MTVSTRRSWLLAVLASACHLPSLVGAQACPKNGLAVEVDGRTIALSAARRQRLPYGKALTVRVGVAGSSPTAVSVRYELEGGSDGPRSGTVSASPIPTTPALLPAGVGSPPSVESSCWIASLPKVRLNETGSITATVFRPARARTGQSEMSFVAAVAAGSLTLPPSISPADFADFATSIATTAARQVYDVSPDSLVLRRPDGNAIRLVDSIAVLLPQDLSVVNVLARIKANAREAAQELGELIATHATVGQVVVPRCRVGSGLAALRASAEALVADTESDSSLVSRLASGDLPWPACALALLDSARTRLPQTPAAAGLVDGARDAVEMLVELPGASTLTAVARRIETVTELAIQVETFPLHPVGAQLLERYTQVDVMAVTLPENGLVQPFAASTLYLSPQPGGKGFRFVQEIEPNAGARFGIQVGYAVGSPIATPKREFEPTVLIGGLARANALISLSLGAVFGREEGKSKNFVFFSTNLDVSNFGPLQQLFARPDR